MIEGTQTADDSLTIRFRFARCVIVYRSFDFFAMPSSVVSREFSDKLSADKAFVRCCIKSQVLNDAELEQLSYPVMYKDHHHRPVIFDAPFTSPGWAVSAAPRPGRTPAGTEWP